MTVLDINDNAPIFATDYETLLCENTTPGQVRPSPPLCWGGGTVFFRPPATCVFSPPGGGSVEAPDTSQGPGSVRRCCCSLAAALSSSCVRAELMTVLLSACGSDPLWHHGIPPLELGCCPRGRKRFRNPNKDCLPSVEVLQI